MYDALGRRIDYLRLSVTDRCNLRCRYCMPQDMPLLRHEDILRYEEYLRLCAIAVSLGISTIKVTGGEPLLRKDILYFLRELKKLPGIEHVTLTTNGVLLRPLLPELVTMGLDGINISLDSLDRMTYDELSGRDEFANVWEALLQALQSGLKVKLNCVPLKGYNEEDILPLARLAESYPLDVRFIELMPTDQNRRFAYIPGEELRRILLQAYPDLEPDERKHGFGPARYYRSAALKGCLGFIDAISNHFCATCNRLRLTAEGFLKLCLYHEEGLDLRHLLRSGASDAEIAAAFTQAVHTKPARHDFTNITNNHGIKRMSRIGG